MPDDIRIPSMNDGRAARAPVSSSYRARRAGPGVGALPIRLIAAGLGGVLLLGMAGWAVMGRRPATIPVIEADSSPVRVKPDNPGGMQIAGADELDDAGGGDRMAPSAEAPAPQALRAQMQAAPAADSPAQGVATGAAVGPPPGAAPSVAVPPPGRGAIAGAPPAAAPPPMATNSPALASASAAPPVTAVKPASGAVIVQLGALGSEAAARAEWQKIAHALPSVLAGRQPSIEKTEHDGHTLWRLRTGGFADTADATGFCAKLRAKGGACTIASF